ncbi:PAS domain-containing sensor histidine kinase, partial [Cesiribacter sp. SM1]|uniref:PAS domain-containing sensor histidine kinase n=1 Tax=Cesiribacter sp. SM1 TaxID=2861196 RepID=UPI001CD26AD8
LVRQKDKLHQVLVEHGIDMLAMFDQELNFLYSGGSTFRIMGYTPEQLVGTNVIHYIHPEDVPQVEEALRQILTSQETVKLSDFRFKDAKGAWRWMETTVSNQLNNPNVRALVSNSRDISSRVILSLELEKLSLVAKKTINGVVIFDADGRVEWVNDGFTRITGYTFAEAAGKFPAVFLSGEETDIATINRIREKLIQDQPFSEEVVAYNKSGQKMWVALDFTPILNDRGELLNVIALQTEITERKQAEIQQLKLTQDLYKQNNDLQQFTYVVSHNLRSPVANVMGLVDIMSTLDKDSDEFDTTLAYLKKCTGKLDGVLKDLNMILSFRDKEDFIEMVEVSVAEKCQQAVEDLQELLQISGGEVNMDIDKSIIVLGNNAYIYSIFHNLLTNSIKYRSLKRTLKIDIKCISSDRTGTIISFQDNGLGFDIDLAGDKLFKLYKRFHNNSDGRGVGLFLIKSHLDAMGGRVEVSSEVDVGTMFLIYFK